MAAYDDDVKPGQNDVDRFSQRSKYQRRNKPNKNNGNMNNVITEHEAKQQIQDLEKKNDEKLDEITQTMYDIQDTASGTLVKLDEQRNQLIKMDKDIHTINGNLDETKTMLNGMKSWKGFIKNKFKKDKQPIPQQYEAPIPKKSVYDRNRKQRVMNKMNDEKNKKPVQLSEYEADNIQNEKLDVLLKGMKELNEMANAAAQELDEHNEIIDNIADKMPQTKDEMQRQNKIMKKICD